MILVTGATGFLGSALTRQLVAAGEPVRILRRPTSRLDALGDDATGQAVADQVEHVVGDVQDPEAVRLAMRDVEHVYHTAAYVGFGGARDAEQLRAVNVAGTAHVVNAALDAPVVRLVHVSSQAALGRPEQPTGVLDETAEWTPSRLNTAYAESKHEAELEVQRGVAEGLDAVLVNPAVIFGPWRPGQNSMEIVDKVRHGKMPAAPSGGTNVVDVEDVAAGARAAMARGATGERYFLGSENLRWNEILGTLADAFGVAGPRLVLPGGLALVAGTLAEVAARALGQQPTVTRETVRVASRFYRYDNRKAVEELGCSFRPFRATAERIAAAVREGRLPAA